MENAGRYRAPSSVHTRVFDGELIVLDLDSGEYFALDAIGTELWTGLQRGKTLEEVANAVVRDYDVALDRALGDLSLLRDELVSRRLLINERA